MFLGNALTSAASGLSSISQQLALVSQNVANAGTPGYAKESLTLTDAQSGDQTYGVRTGQVLRATDNVLQTQLFASVGQESAAQVTQASLQRVDQTSGAPGSGQDLVSMMGALQDSFSTLETDPSNATQQSNVVNQAKSLASGINGIGTALAQERQTAQDSLVDEVSTANTALHALGSLSSQIIAAQARGDSTADLESQRDEQMRTVAQLTGAHFVTQGNGDVLVMAGSTILPTRADSGPFSLANANLSNATSTTAAPSLVINGVAGGKVGGQMGANLTLRDTTIPGLQSGLDSFAQSLASGFAGQGLTLFTDGSGSVPTAAGAAGFATSIQVSSAVAATPSMVRDGASPSGVAGDTTLIDKVLNNVFAGGSGSLTGQATTLLAGYASAASNASSEADTATAIRTGLDSKLSAETGVSVDNEMSDMIRLQNAYAANAKMIQAVQDMWTQLLQTVQ